MDVNVDLLQWLTNFLIKNSSNSSIKNEIVSNKELAEELYKSIITKIVNKEKYTQLLQTIFGAQIKQLIKI